MLTTGFYVAGGKLEHDHGSASNTGWVFARDGKDSSRLVIAKNTVGARGDHTSIVEIPQSFHAATRRHPNAWAILQANMRNGGSEIGPAETICALVSDCDSWDTVTETGGGNICLPLSVLDPEAGDRVAYVPTAGAGLWTITLQQGSTRAAILARIRDRAIAIALHGASDEELRDPSGTNSYEEREIACARELAEAWDGEQNIQTSHLPSVIQLIAEEETQ